MSEINVRRLTFAFPEDLPVLPDPTDVRGSCDTVGLSFTLPYLEPYLNRTMRAAAKHVTDPRIAEDMRRFVAQEGNHYRNHARINDIVRAKLSPSVAAEVSRIEAELKADYARFSSERSLKFNLAYAEGFEAMTLAFTLTGFEIGGRENQDPHWRDLLEWHGSEEVEHRTVTFDAYEHLFGDYFYRVYRGLLSQIHYLSYIRRFARAIRRDFEHLPAGVYSGAMRKTLPRYLRTFSPRYDPAKIDPSDRVRALWQRYDLRAEIELGVRQRKPIEET